MRITAEKLIDLYLEQDKDGSTFDKLVFGQKVKKDKLNTEPVRDLDYNEPPVVGLQGASRTAY